MNAQNDRSSRRRSLTPYQGPEPYAFLSYSHRNMDAALDFVERMQADGYRVWYDEGIDPGTEWDENIASHVDRCAYFIALISPEYIESSNCKDELNFARDLEKPRLLIYLQKTELPAGMRMRLSRLQAIHRYTYADQEAFFDKLRSADGLDVCLGIPAEAPSFAAPSERERQAKASPAARPQKTEAPMDNPDAERRLIAVVDTSASMTGDRIAAVNEGLQSLLSLRSGTAVDILQFDTSPAWRSPADLPLKAGGVTNAGKALRALAKRGPSIPAHCACSVLFVMDGTPSDPWKDAMEALRAQKWFRAAKKAAVAIGMEPDETYPAVVAGGEEAVRRTEDLRILPALILSEAAAMLRDETHEKPSLAVGNTVRLGHYPQTAPGGDSTPIEWTVLDVRDGAALVISRYGLDAQPYHARHESVSWAGCSLRRWLNTDFASSAFTAGELARIVPTVTIPDTGPRRKSSAPAPDTLFLLNAEEAETYFAGPAARVCAATDRAAARGAHRSASSACWWWLRSQALSYKTARVLSDGTLDSRDVDSGSGGVRPAMWILAEE